MQHTATHCHTLPHIATPCSTLQHTATHCNTSQHTGMRSSCAPQRSPHHMRSSARSSETAYCCVTVCCRVCGTLQHTATHCNTLQHTATHCNTDAAADKRHTTKRVSLQRTATHCNTLQHTATHYNTLQHTATHFNTGAAADKRQRGRGAKSTSRCGHTRCSRCDRDALASTGTSQKKPVQELCLTNWDVPIGMCMSRCNRLQHTATHRNALQRTVTHCNALQRTATHCSALQHNATHCTALQHTATHCNTLQQRTQDLSIFG